ncbi:hypothetical protein L228DRAFT_59889 [Xylona heveae TC161]|uniref:Trichome differentiation protein GL1 n=1 Tax=Xylona heveae (strain CBS 132557 / TC161) TaxID=1328760 RepID=A0A165IJW4_XYLHT|nr:hypothetical protein L228DRAFT_59889 [Xylona heveae TC161]KZF24996.1 hypothetical protein L228DRAFT_59889 [Xylona heveae TC161]
MAPHKRGPWSQQEDAYLLQLVHSQGAHNWVRISHLIGSRSPKQCRERYHQNLKPTLNHNPITPEEGIVIERLVGEMGKRWAEIARRLCGRSDNAVKNWWNGGMNRRRRLYIRRGDSRRVAEDFDEKTEQLSFAKPVASLGPRPTSLNIMPSRRHIETPLPSPSALSIVSRADSSEGAPSLVSDSGSVFSFSPRMPGSPSVELPPLVGARTTTTITTATEGRRPSLPILHLGTNSYVSEHEHQLPSLTRFDTERKAPLTPQPATLPRPGFATEPTLLDYHYMRHQPTSLAMSSHVQLPSFQKLTGTPVEQGSPSRDTRMNLSTLLA